MKHPAPTPPPGSPPEHFPAPWASDWGENPYGLWQSLTYRAVRQAFRWLPPGRFLMGSPANEHARENDELQHEVMLTRGFWLAETACTQALWQAVMGQNPSSFKGERRPVEQGSWNDVQDFIARPNAGAELVDIKALLGHESIATTQIYTNVGQERMEKVVARL